MNNELLTRILSSLVIIPIVSFFIIKGSIFFNFFILVLLFITLYEWHYLSVKKVYYLPGIMFIFFPYILFIFLEMRTTSLFFG